MRVWKVLDVDRQAFHGGRGQWPEPGVWTDERTAVPCESGWHLCRDGDLLRWLGPCIWVAEIHPDATVVKAEDKIIVSRARLVSQTPWDERMARLFVADCAERVLPIFESARPDDDRPRRAVEAARAFARKEIDRRELAAARAAARAAAWDAAWVAAPVAAWVAARAAAWVAARAAAWDAEREWQMARLIAYLTGEVTS